MKLTTLLLIVGIMQVSATSLAQRVVLSEKNAPLAEVFEKISQQTGYDFVFTKSILSQAKPITLQFSGDLGDALKMIFSDEPLEYQISDKSVLVKTKEGTSEKKAEQSKPAQAAIDVVGRVTDENNQPLNGATVQVKDGNNSTTTDPNGFFTLKNVQLNTAIVITFIGYDKKEVTAKANLGQIKLIAATSPLDEVKVIGYGKTSERFSLGDVTSVKAADIEKQPVNNPILALQGRVPGLVITQPTGLPGGGITVRIQGKSSLNKGSNPLYIIDNVPYPDQMQINPVLSATLGSGGGSLGTAGSPLNYINPSDIESISVLKDAEATAIYGSRAAAGAIIITTKKGKAGDMRVNVDLQQGITQPSRSWDMMNTQQYLLMRKEGLRNDGLLASPFDYDLNFWNQSVNTDWQKTLIKQSAPFSKFNGSISGGSDLTQYSFSGGYNHTGVPFTGDFGDQSVTSHLNVNSSSTNRRFHLQVSVSYSADNNTQPMSDITKNAFALAPNAPSLYNADGSLNWMQDSGGNSSWTNPLTAAPNLNC